MNSAGRHALVHSLHNDGYAFRLQHVLDAVGNLRCHLFLYLESTCECFDDARQFADTDHLALRQITDVRFADDRRHVMFAVRMEGDVAQQDDLVTDQQGVQRLDVPAAQIAVAEVEQQSE